MTRNLGLNKLDESWLNIDSLLGIRDNTVPHEEAHQTRVFGDAQNVMNAEGYLNNLVRPSVNISCFDNISITPSGYLYGNNSNSVLKRSFPGYLEEILSNSFYSSQKEREVCSSKSIIYSKLAIVWIHPHSRIFGHFLIECLPKLFVILGLRRNGVGGSVYVSDQHPKYVYSYLDLLEIDYKVVQSDQSVFAKKALVIEDYVGYKFPRFVVKEIRAIGAKYRDGSTPERIYISRERLKSSSGFRVLSNEGEVVRLVQKFGFEVIYPEELSIEEQVRYFSNAKVVVGEYGSALHNSMFSDIGTKVVSINWINEVQQSLGINFGHENIVITPQEGHIKAPSASTQEVVKFTVDLDVLLCVLEDVCSANL